LAGYVAVGCVRLSFDFGDFRIKRIGERASFGFIVACGYALANAGHDTRAIQDWLGHRSIQHTVRYTELTPTRFKDFWRGEG
jgi:integrase